MFLGMVDALRQRSPNQLAVRDGAEFEAEAC
jgi:hypothetical protein